VEELERLECIVGGQDAMAGLAQRLIDQLLHGGVLLENKEGRGAARTHAATLTSGSGRRQTQMGRSGRPESELGTVSRCGA